MISLWLHAAIVGYLLSVCSSNVFNNYFCNGRIKFTKQSLGEIYDPFTKSYKSVFLYTLSNCNRMTVEIINYGATIKSIKIPDGFGKIDDVALGFDNVEGYMQDANPSMGATVGRVAGRITNATFNISLDGSPSNVKVYRLDKNDGENTLHGGFHNFANKFWREVPSEIPDSVRLELYSPDHEGGFPGSVTAEVTYTLTQENELSMHFKAATDSDPTPISMTNHAYFNLAGQDQGSQGLYRQFIKILADKYIPVDKNGIPSETCDLADVTKTWFDLRNWTNIGRAIEGVRSTTDFAGFDHTFVLSSYQADQPPNYLKKTFLAAEVYDYITKRRLSVYASQPGLVFYTSNSLNIRGKGGAHYDRHWALCLENEYFPDSVNHPNYPSNLIYPDKPYDELIIYKFDII